MCVCVCVCNFPDGIKLKQATLHHRNGLLTFTHALQLLQEANVPINFQLNLQ